MSPHVRLWAQQGTPCRRKEAAPRFVAAVAAFGPDFGSRRGTGRAAEPAWCWDLLTAHLSCGRRKPKCKNSPRSCRGSNSCRESPGAEPHTPPGSRADTLQTQSPAGCISHPATSKRSQPFGEGRQSCALWPGPLLLPFACNCQTLAMCCPPPLPASFRSSLMGNWCFIFPPADPIRLRRAGWRRRAGESQRGDGCELRQGECLMGVVQTSSHCTASVARYSLLASPGPPWGGGLS